jgi:AcrR family transcriptional regulator
MRILSAALDLFADHGVSGTSLQMIADTIGVTKAAIYHQFKTKEEIVTATADRELVTLEAAVEAAEAAPDRDRARSSLLRELVDFAVQNRALVRAWQGDPAMMRVLANHKPFSALTTRMYSLLVEQERDTDWRVPAAMLAAVVASVGQPGLAEVDHEALRKQVYRYACRLLAISA